MAEDGDIDEATVKLHQRLHAAEEHALELERVAEKQRRRTEEAEEKIIALGSTIAFLRAHNALLLKENRQLASRLEEFERLAARGVDRLVASSAEMARLVAKKESAFQAFLDAECFPRFSKRYTVPVVYDVDFYDGIQTMDERQVDIVKRAIRQLVDHGQGGTPKQAHRKIERLIEGTSVPIGAMMSHASKKLRYFWILSGEGTKRKLAVLFADQYR